MFKKAKLQTTSNKCAKWVAATVSLAKSRKFKLAKLLVQLHVFKRTKMKLRPTCFSTFDFLVCLNVFSWKIARFS